MIRDRDLAEGDDRSAVGGKAAGLALLLRQGLPVPSFFVVLPGDDLTGLEAALQDLGPGPWAVRSSAQSGDGARCCCAGQLESVLGVPTAEQVRAAIAACRASGGAEPVRACCTARGDEPGPVAVVVQRLILGRASGAMATRDPDQPDCCLISAAWGLGAGGVRGSADRDAYRIDAQGGFSCEIVTKRLQVAFVHGGLTEIPVPDAEQTAPVLTEAQARQLCTWGRSLERLVGRPQEVEWTLDGQQLCLLQTRSAAPVPSGRRLLWSDTHVVESFFGVTTPLTYSFARGAYATVFSSFCRALGVPADTLQEHGPVFERLLGLIRGRIYCDLDAWQRVLSLMPGLRSTRMAVAKLMGIPEAVADQDTEVVSSTWQRVASKPRAMRAALHQAWRLLRLRRDIRSFEKGFSERYGRWRARELDTLAPEELLDAYRDLQRGVLMRWLPPVVNDVFQALFFADLRRLCTRELCGGDALAGVAYANALVAVQGGLESTAPTLELLRRAARLRAAPWAVELFEGPLSDAEVLAEVRREPSFSRWLDDWLQRWGERRVDELKLETPPLTARPEAVVAILRRYLRGQPIDPEHLGEAERRHRERAEAEALRRLTGLGRLRFRWVLGRTRECGVVRERMRFLRAGSFGLARDLFRALGAHMAAAGELPTADDVVWLEVEEILGWVEGTATCTDLAGLAALRRAEFTRFAAEPSPPERFQTWGAVHRANRFSGRRATPSGPGDVLLRGTPCYPGLVAGPAVVLSHPARGIEHDGPILVVPHTDPGWVPLLPSVVGLLVERGSPLSHSALVARELGIPTIVGIPGLTALVKDGQRVRMDGAAGTVKILARTDESG